MLQHCDSLFGSFDDKQAIAYQSTSYHITDDRGAPTSCHRLVHNGLVGVKITHDSIRREGNARSAEEVSSFADAYPVFRPDLVMFGRFVSGLEAV